MWKSERRLTSQNIHWLRIQKQLRKSKKKMKNPACLQVGGERSCLPLVQVALFWTPSSSPSPQVQRHFEIERKRINLLLYFLLFPVSEWISQHSPLDTPLLCPPVNSATYTHTDTQSHAPQDWSTQIDKDLLRGEIKTTHAHTLQFFLPPFLLPTRSAAFFLLSLPALPPDWLSCFSIT